VWLEHTINHVWLPGIAGNSLTAAAPAGTANYLATKTDNTTTTAAAAPGAFTFTTVGAWKSIALRDAGNVVLTTVDLTTLTAGTQTTWTGTGAETWTLNRATSGRKSVCVVAPVWVLGTDDYMEVPDSADLDFGASDDFTILAVVRKWANAATTPILFKRTNDLNGSAGWNLYTLSTGNAVAKMSDATNVVLPVRAYTAGALSVIGGVRDVTADTLTTYVDGTGTSASDTTTATLANSEPLRVGRYSGGSTYGDFEFIAGAVWRRALTAAEVTALTTYFTTRG
jgi:hypothetical protein